MGGRADTVRLTVGQAVVRFLARQWTERDGVRRRLVAGCFGIFGHGNVAGVGQALLESTMDSEASLPYHLARNEQAMVHVAAGYARHSNRLSTLACTTSIGPGATNLVTGAALATVNRLPVLLLPGDIFATRVANPVLQELEDSRSHDVSVNDCLRPVSKYWDRVNRPEQLPAALLAAARVLTDPAETGAVTVALPQDVQAEAYDWPARLFADRVWRIPRPVPEPEALAAAAAAIGSARRPLLIAGGGLNYAEANGALADFVAATGIPVAETQAGKGALRFDHPSCVGAIGVTGTAAANTLAREADLVIGVGTRYSDFTTASRTLFGDPDVTFVNLNVATFDADKHAGVPLVADAREGLIALTQALAGHQVTPEYRRQAAELAAQWQDVVDRAYRYDHGPQLAQTAVIGAVNEAAGEYDVVVNAAGSMPGDLHKLWRTTDPKQYHVEYGYSCMGYEIAGGLGVKLAADAESTRDSAAPEREVFVLVGDGSYLMMAQELVTAVAEGVKLVVVIVDNGGFASIGGLSQSVGAQRFGTAYRFRDPATGQLDGDPLPVDLAANAASLGVDAVRVSTVDQLRSALAAARAAARTTVVYVPTDPTAPAPESGAWWDVPVAQVATLASTREARRDYEAGRTAQRRYL